MQTDYYYDYPNYSGKNPKQGYYFETYYIEYLLWALQEYIGETEIKRCSKCGYECKLGVAGEYFNRRSSRKSGYQSVCKVCQADYYKANRETHQNYMKQWHIANKEARANYDKQWSKANRDKKNAAKHKRRTKKRGNGGAYTVAEEQLLFQWQGEKCAYCQCDISEGYARDHIQPISAGGTSNIDNIALSCQPCNNSKYNKPLWIWLGIPFALEFFERRKAFNILLATSKL